jgi:hypothetical protein
MKLLVSVIFLLAIQFVSGQITQSVRGRVLDSETQIPLIGSRVQLITEDTTQVVGAIVDFNGEFVIQNVSIGKQRLKISYIGYETTITLVTVNSGREAIVTVYLQEKAMETNEVVVTGRSLDQTINEMATISAQQFSIEETERYAGSRADPARMVSNFAGVQGTDDSRNDIVVRGNSPLGLLWRVEGVDIPSPNHFAISGSTGGPVSILNNKFLDNSDFFMSAFPAQYGNSMSAVFDLNLRRGNADRHEFTGQFGFLGTEVLLEGPLSSKSRASYLVMGRYSSLAMFQAMGLQIGTSAVPQYGDIAFKFNYPLKKGGQLSVWGMGGQSAINIKISDQTEIEDELYGEGDRDQYFTSKMGVGGVTYKKPINEKTFVHATIAGSYEHQSSRHEKVWRTFDTTSIDGVQNISIHVDSIYPLMSYNFNVSRLSSHFSVNHKINRRQLIKFGLNAELQHHNMKDSVLQDIMVQGDFRVRWDYQGTAGLIQPFIQWKYRISERMNLVAGLHSQYYSLSNSWSYVEPRLGWDYTLDDGSKFKFGAGMHSQTQPLYIYSFHQTSADGQRVYHNQNMDFSRSIHLATGYQKSFKNKMRIATEVYYQNLYNIPVNNYSSAFSLNNMGSGFQRFFPDSLVNEGTGKNYGIELTIEKYFDKSFFFLITGSLFDSKYQGSDKVWRDTDYNGKYATNLLIGKEFKWNEKNMISIGAKVTYAGGRRYGYVDIEKSNALQEIVFLDSAYNTRQFRDYFRFDVKILYRLNANKVTHEIGLDLVNVLNTENFLSLVYAPNTSNPTAEPTAVRTQLGFLPIFYYRIDFRVNRKKKE